RQAPPRPAQWRGCRSLQSAVRLLLPSALPLRHGQVQGGGATAARHRHRTSRGLPLRRYPQPRRGLRAGGFDRKCTRMSRQPNILWICTDHQRFDTIGALGNPHVSTPNIDKLVADGTAFERTYCQAPICTPSRSSFLTGVYPSTARANRNGNGSFSGTHPLVTRTMADNGYTCGNIGKLHLASPYQRPEPRADDGYAVFEYSHAPRDG